MFIYIYIHIKRVIAVLQISFTFVFINYVLAINLPVWEASYIINFL